MKKYNYHDFLAHFGIGAAHPGGFALTKELTKSESLSPQHKVLEVGCGTGQSAAYLAQTYGCQVTAIEPHPLMLQKAAQRFRKERLPIQLIQGSSEKLPFPGESFDFLLAESVTIFTNIVPSLKEYARVLRPGGVVLDIDMTAGLALTKAQQEEFKELYSIPYVPTEREWKKAFRLAGFRLANVVKKGTVASALSPKQHQYLEQPEWNPSAYIDPSLYDIWGKHQDITQKYANQMQYVAYRLVK